MESWRFCQVIPRKIVCEWFVDSVLQCTCDASRGHAQQAHLRPHCFQGSPGEDVAHAPCDPRRQHVFVHCSQGNLMAGRAGARNTANLAVVVAARGFGILRAAGDLAQHAVDNAGSEKEWRGGRQAPAGGEGRMGRGSHLVCPPPPCDIPSGCCSFTGPWTVTRSSLRMLRRVFAFCRPLRPVLLLVSFPRSRSPVVGVPGLCWMWHGVPFARQWRPVVAVLRMCWLLPGSFDCFAVHAPLSTGRP